MPGRDIIVVGFSAGGIEPLVRLVADLPRDLPAALFVVHHFPAGSVSALPSILQRAGPLPASHPEHEQRIEPGRIYIAPPGRHMLINGNRILITSGPRENGHRPAIDPLFRTAARAHGAGVIGVLLSGSLDDGVEGLMAVKQRGGVTVVQDPAEALHPGIPRSAIEMVPVDHVLRADEMAGLLARLASEPIAAKEVSHAMMPEDLDPQDPAESGTADIETGPLPGPPSALTCPDCGGALWEMINGNLVRYRCHVGHAYTAGSMVAAQADKVENALWTALRALEEKAEVYRRMGQRTRGRGLDRLASRYHKALQVAEHGSDSIRQLLLAGSGAAPDAVDAGAVEEAPEDLAGAKRS